jgi:hypothetical protein
MLVLVFKNNFIMILFSFLMCVNMAYSFSRSALSLCAVDFNFSCRFTVFKLFYIAVC